MRDANVTQRLDVISSITSTMSALIGPMLGEEMAKALLSYTTDLVGSDLIDYNYFLAEKPEIFEKVVTDLFRQGSIIIFRVINANLVKEYCPNELNFFYSGYGDYVKLIEHIKNNS